MTTVPEKDQTQKIRVTESVAKLLRDKDRIICMQAKRIDILERELLKFRKERDSLACQVSDLTDRISMDYSIEEMLVIHIYINIYKYIYFIYVTYEMQYEYTRCQFIVNF